MKRIITIGAITLGAVIIAGGLSRRHARASVMTSGLPVGATLNAFRPWHASGADKGTMECPVCKYTSNPAVQVWVNGDSEQNVLTIATNLEKELATNSDKKLKAFVVYANVDKQPDKPLRSAVSDLATKYKLKNVAMVVVGSRDRDAVRANEINPDPRIKNTVFVYKKLKINSKFINLAADETGLAALDAAVKQVLN